MARRLATLQLQDQQALSKVSDTLFAGLKTAASQCQDAARASRGLLFPAAAAGTIPSSSHQDSEVASIVLHPQEFEAKLLELHSAAFKMNVSVHDGRILLLCSRRGLDISISLAVQCAVLIHTAAPA